MIQANCRAQFTAEDFAFIVRVLAKTSSQEISLVQLLGHESERDAVLDDEALYHTVLDETACLNVSSAFYFYIMTRRVLQRAQLHERELTDYIAALLLNFSRTQALRSSEEAYRHQFTYISDLLLKLQNCSPEQAYLLRTYLANYSLFLSGIFAERVQSQANLRGSPGLGFYESIGQSSYRTAAQHPQSKLLQLQEIFTLLGTEFHRVRLALNDLTDTLFHWHDPVPAPIPIRPKF